MEDLQPALELGGYRPEVISVEDILSNSALCTPFDGVHQCFLCDDRLEISDIADIITHLATKHLRDLAAAFSCPTCLVVHIVDASTFGAHWRMHHANKTAFICILQETNIGPRMQMGMALRSLLATMSVLDLELPNPMPANECNLGALAGYGNMAPAQLEKFIHRHQCSLLPPDYQATSQNYRDQQATQRATAAAAAQNI